jgi:hypothetical protein
MPVTARLAYTADQNVNVTVRGRSSTSSRPAGFIRVNGKTVSGWLHIASDETVFFTTGKNSRVPYAKSEAA